MLYATVCITGAAVLVVEIAALRILAPHYGSSTFVFSGILTVVLAALSVGYYVGGVLADKRPSYAVLYIIIMVSGVLVLGIQAVDAVLFRMVAEVFAPLTGLLCISLALFFLPAFLLGMVSPAIIKLQSMYTPADAVGKTVGLVFFWGTIGSILGSIVGGFYCIPVWGVTQTLIVWGMVLVLLGLCGTSVFWFSTQTYTRPVRVFIQRFWMYLLLLCATVLLLINTTDASQVRDHTVLYEGEGRYSHILVYERPLDGDVVRHLKRDTNHSSASFVYSDELAYPYSKFAEFFSVLKPDTDRFLLIGGGAYSIPRTLVAKYPDITVDVSEIEPELFDLAQEYFGLTDTTRINNYVQDGRVFLHETTAQYDVIFEDAFGSAMSLPVHLVTKEFYELVRSRLAPEGILMVNYVGVLRGVGTPSVTGSTIQTIRSVFPNTKVYALNKDNPYDIQNIMIIARNGDTDIDFAETTLTGRYLQEERIADMEIAPYYFALEDEIVFTDDQAPLEYLWLMQ